MSDRPPNWLEQHATLLETLCVQQQTLAKTWSSWLDAWQDGRATANAWDALSRLAADAARQPSFGPIEPELLRRSAELTESWLASLGAMQRYQSIGLRAHSRITSQFLDDLAAADRDPPDSLRALFERWIGSGDRVLLDMYRTDEYLAAQRELLETLMRCRVRWQALQDVLARGAGRPTREELDDAYRSIHELRRELRGQRRRLRELTDSAATGAGASPVPSEEAGANGAHAASGGTNEAAARRADAEGIGAERRTLARRLSGEHGSPPTERAARRRPRSPR